MRRVKKLLELSNLAGRRIRVLQSLPYFHREVAQWGMKTACLHQSSLGCSTEVPSETSCDTGVGATTAVSATLDTTTTGRADTETELGSPQAHSSGRCPQWASVEGHPNSLCSGPSVTNYANSARTSDCTHTTHTNAPELAHQLLMQLQHILSKR